MMEIDKTEIMHILISVVTISLAFSAYRWGSFPVMLLTVGLGFVFHEMGHKITAQKLGAKAFYRAWMPGLALALGLALTSGGSFVFAAPGAVYIWGKQISIKENGLIAAAGPAINLIIGFLFFLFIDNTSSLIRMIALYGAYVNFFLAFFNMIPIPPLDGSKIIRWSLPAWGAMIGIAAYFVYMVF